MLDAAAAITQRLVADCPGVTVLATSREPLDITGERVLALPPLALPASDDPAQLPGSPAVQLLLARARDAGVEVGLDGESAAAVAALCRRLDGLPLAIELAAARTRSLTRRRSWRTWNTGWPAEPHPGPWPGPAPQPGGSDRLVLRAAAIGDPAVLRPAGRVRRPVHH